MTCLTALIPLTMYGSSFFSDDPNNPLILDDFHNLKTSVLTEMQTDQLINGRFDTSTDLDYFDVHMEPGQPFVISGGALRMMEKLSISSLMLRVLN